MAKQTKLKCLGCEDVYYVADDEAEDVVPDGAVPGEAFRAHCPFCKRQEMVKLAE